MGGKGEKAAVTDTGKMLSQMARRVMCRCYLAHRRLLHAAALDSIGAARMEAAAAGLPDRARYLAREDDALAPRAWIGERHCREQCLGIGMKGCPEECVLLRELDDLSEIHDGDPVADVLDHREIMRNEEVGEPQPRPSTNPWDAIYSETDQKWPS